MFSVNEQQGGNDAIEMMKLAAVFDKGMASAISASSTATTKANSENVLAATAGDEIRASIDELSVNSQDNIVPPNSPRRSNESEDRVLLAATNIIVNLSAQVTNTPVQVVNLPTQVVNFPAQIIIPPAQVVSPPAQGNIAPPNTPLSASDNTIETAPVDTGFDLERQGRRHIFKRHNNPPCHGKEHGSRILEAKSGHLFWNHAFLFAMPAVGADTEAVRIWLANAFELSDDLDMAQLPSITINGLGLRVMRESSFKALLNQWGISEAGVTFIWQCVEAARRNADLEAEDARILRKNKKKLIKHFRLFMAGVLFCFLIAEPMLGVWINYHFKIHDPAYGAIVGIVWIVFFIPLVYCFFRDYHYNLTLWARFREFWALA